MADDATFNQGADEQAAMGILEQEEPLAPKGDEVEEGEEKPEKPEVEEDEKEDKEGKEEEEKEEEEDKEEEKPQIVPIHKRPTVRDINSKYPNFFKDFPDMRHVLFREGEYAQVFPTVDDAKAAADDAQSFSNLRNLVTSGTKQDFSEFLKGVDQEQGALTKMASNFLPGLYTTNKDLYFQVTQPIAESLLRNAYRTGKAGNENLLNAALVISQWAFGDQGYATGEKQTAPPEEPKKDPELEKERQNFFVQKYNDTKSFVSDGGAARMKAEIARGFDPNNAFPEYTRNLLIKQVLEEVGNQLEKDQRHMAAMNGLWQRAYKAGFVGDWKDRILATYLSGARAIMPAIRARVRSAAMNDTQRTAEQTETRARKSEDRKEVRGAATPRGGNNRTPQANEIDWSKTSDLDFLNDRITYRKK